eukprot:699041-Rhodomonas_salina.1
MSAAGNASCRERAKAFLRVGPLNESRELPSRSAHTYRESTWFAQSQESVNATRCRQVKVLPDADVSVWKAGSQDALSVSMN